MGRSYLPPLRQRGRERHARRRSARNFICRRVPDPFDIEDILQEVVYDLLKPIPQHC
jgi:DNA-directed RNA polymerase specialized sigma24 family protein